MTTPKIEVSQSGAVTTVVSDGGISLMQFSDVHFDSILCYREQLFADLQYCVDHDIHALFLGDSFDAMNGRFDPRRSMELVRPEYRFEDYYDKLVSDAIKQLKPYASHIMMIAYGNHETSVLKNANTDLVSRLASGLSTKDHTVFVGGYGGILLFNESGESVPAKYFHGSGGEAPVTRGAIQTNRQAVFLPDYNMVMNGHSHHNYVIPITRERVTREGNHYFDFQWHLRSPGYVMAYGDGSKGWEVMRGGVPKPIGSVYIRVEGDKVRPTSWITPPITVVPSFDHFDGIEFPQE